MDNEKRPSLKNSTITTPVSGAFMQLLGPGMTYQGLAFSKTETTNLNKLYGFTKEKPNKKPAKPEEPDYKDANGKPMSSWDRRFAEQQYEKTVKDWENWKDPIHMMQAGADRNMIRHAESDGLRMVAWLAKHCEPGKDPLKVLIQMAIDAGFDVDPEDVTYSEYEGEDFDEEDAAE